jgi:predicted nucleotidyltransferase
VAQTVPAGRNMQLSDFLNYHGITLKDVAALAESSLHLTADDTLFVCGSVVEGFGNEKSDLDLLLISARENLPLTSRDATLLMMGRCAIDLRVIRRAAAEELLKRFVDWVDEPRQPRSAMAFTHDERLFLHRLRSGEALAGTEDFRQLQNKVRLTDLSRHRLDCAQYMATRIQVDLAGLRGAGDQYSVLFAAQELLGHTVDALLAGYNYSNPHLKWRVRQLSELRSDWESDLPGRRTGMSARDLYWSLHAAPASASPGAILDHALRIVAFSRRVFPWAESRLLSPTSPTLFSFDRDDTGTGQPLPHLDLDVAVRYRDGKFELLRLHGDGVIFTLSPEEYSLSCLFDGETSSNKENEELLQEMIALVRHGDLEARPFMDEQALTTILHRASTS